MLTVVLQMRLPLYNALFNCPPPHLIRPQCYGLLVQVIITRDTKGFQHGVIMVFPLIRCGRVQFLSLNGWWSVQYLDQQYVITDRTVETPLACQVLLTSKPCLNHQVFLQHESDISGVRQRYDTFGASVIYKGFIVLLKST